MTNENILHAVSKEAAVDLSSSRYRAVVLTNADKVTAVTASTDKPFGIIQNIPVTGEMGEVVPIGPGGSTLIELSEVLAAGASISIDASGKGAASTSGNYDLGILETGGNTGDLGKVLLNNLVVKA